jgi:hypothetical protein
LRSFSKAFMTIQSNSPRTSLVSLAGSVPRLVARVGNPSAVLSFALGLAGSCSRMTRSISSSPTFPNSWRLNGGLPVSSSYSKTPSE